MAKTEQEINKVIRDFIILNVFNGKDTGELKNDTELISSRLIDSIFALKMVSHLEETFGIEFQAHEVDQDNLNTIDTITKFVQSKLK